MLVMQEMEVEEERALKMQREIDRWKTEQVSRGLCLCHVIDVHGVMGRGYI